MKFTNVLIVKRYISFIMEHKNKSLILLRGLPGSGKTTLAKILGGKHFETDTYFMISVDPSTKHIIHHSEKGKYSFDSNLLKTAHKDCFDRVENSMLYNEEKIIVSNTFTQEWEMEEYFDIAKKYDYMIFTLIVENRHNNTNIHNVSDERLEEMRNRFNIKL